MQMVTVTTNTSLRISQFQSGPSFSSTFLNAERTAENTEGLEPDYPEVEDGLLLFYRCRAHVITRSVH